MFVVGWIVAAIVVASPDMGANLGSDRSNTGLCSPAAPEPARGGRVEGHVTWEDKSPRANVQIRARTNSRTYVTTSDETGAYALDVADDVFLEFRDARERVGAACFVRLVTSKVAIVDVILGLPRDDDQASLGCQVPADWGASKWTWFGSPTFLDSKEAEAAFGPPQPATSEVRFDLERTDVAAVQMTTGGAQLLLTPAATERARTFFNENVGRMIVTAIGGVPVIRAVVWVRFPASTPMPLDIRASSLTPEQRAKVCELLKTMGPN